MSDALLSPFSGTGGDNILGYMSPSDFTSMLHSGSKESTSHPQSADSDAHGCFYRDSKGRGDVWITPDRKTVEWHVDDQCIRKFHYDENVIKANFVDFATGNDCLVAILQDVAHVYYISKGDSTTVCFPFSISNAFWCSQGIVLERKQPHGTDFDDLSDFDLQHRFITLSDPMAPFGYLDFSNNGKDAMNLRNLTMLVFPNGRDHNITVLFDNSGLKLHFYYTQILDSPDDNTPDTQNTPHAYSLENRKDTLDNANASSSAIGKNLRKISILNRRAASVSMTQDINDFSMLPTTKKMQDSQSLLQTHPNSSRRSISATLDRMSGTTPIAAASPNIEFSSHISQQTSQVSQPQIQGQQPDQHQMEGLNQVITTRGDITLTKISSMTLPHRVPNDPSIVLKCIPLRFQDKEAIVIFDPLTHFSKIWLIDLIPEIMNSISFKVYGNSPPDLIRLSNFNVDGLISDILPYQSDIVPGTLAVILDSFREVCLYNPFVNLESPKQSLDDKICFISCDRMVKNKFDSLTNMNTRPVKEVHYMPSVFPLPRKSLVKHCFESMKWICSPKIFIAIIFSWQLLMNRQLLNKADFTNSEFFALETVFKSLLLASDGEPDRAAQLHDAKSFKYLIHLDSNSFIPKTVMGLHLIREELSLNVLCEDDVNQLGNLLSFATTRMNWPLPWREYYGAHINENKNGNALIGIFAHPLDEPPSIMKSLYSVTENSYLLVTPFISFSRLIEMDSQVDQMITPQSYKILRLYEMIRAPDYSDKFLLEVLTNLKIVKEDIELYPIGVLAPLKKRLKKIEDRLAQVYSDADLSIISRHDLERCVSAIKQISMETELLSSGSDRLSKIVPKLSQSNHSKPKDIYTILSDVIKSTRQFNAEKGLITDTLQDSDDFDEGHTLKANAALIFSEDRRFNYALSLLIYYKPHSVQFVSVETDYRKILKQKKNMARILSIRTCLSGLGFGAVAYSTEKPLATQKWVRPELNFTYLFPDGTKISMDSNELDKEILNWGEFHGGVSSGLRISRKAKGINGSWIAFNKPKILDAQHGGFLLGLGLNGHLRGLEEWHVYNYLSPKKTHVSIGLLLGMSASMKGTMDLKLTKVLSVHIVALLPPGSSDLNINLKVQTAGIVGIGLLYLMSQHRRMTEVLYSQLKAFIIINDERVCDESYRLAAGISLGLINLAAGSTLSGRNGADQLMMDQDVALDLPVSNGNSPDEKITSGLLQILTESHDSEQDWIPENSQISATVALMLIFLKTRHTQTANLIKPVLKSMNMNYRPEIFMYRELAFHLIMWDTIGKDLAFVLGDLEDQIEFEMNTDNLPVYYIIGGRTLAMGIKYASTGNQEMRDALLTLIDKFLPFYQYPGNNRLDFRLTILGVNVLVNVLIVSVSMIMCGTGDLQVLRRIRYLHEIVSGRHSDLFKTYKTTKRSRRNSCNSTLRETGSANAADTDQLLGVDDEEGGIERREEEQEDPGGEEEEVEDEEEGYEEVEESGLGVEEGSESATEETSEETGGEFSDPASDVDDKKDDENHYAKYIASTMSLGFLFLGSGQYALKTSDTESLAYLIISVLPTYMSSSPLQETKYFWSMAVEPRCLMFRNADTEMSINGVPFFLTACFNESVLETKELKAPCLLPDIRKIKSLRVIDPNYYPLEINFGKSLKATDFFKNGSIVYIQPRNNKKSNVRDINDLSNHRYQNIGDIQAALKSKIEKIPSFSTAADTEKNCTGLGDELFSELSLNDKTMIELETVTSEKKVFTDDMRIYDLDMLCSDNSSGNVTDFQLEIWRKKHCE